VFERPADIYVAGFIGAPAMNFLPATLARDGTAAQLAAGPLLPFADGRRAGADGAPLTLGIRPEHLALGRCGLSLAVDLVEPLGSETLVHGRLRADATQDLVVKLSGRAPEGDVLELVVPAEHVHVFDSGSGRRLDPVQAENRPVRLAAGQSAD